MELLKTHKTFNGKTQFWSHDSNVTKTKMKFSTFIPHGEIKGCLIWLSGLTCTDENFITKAGAQKVLSEKNLMIICPDTSPRGLDLPGEHDSYDFGSGAGFYINATTEGYRHHYLMFDYINGELYQIIQNQFNVNRISIFGHSMGGHGALILGLTNPEKYAAISAFSPIVNPTQCPWGQKAFKGYLGEDKKSWNEYDACELVKAHKKHEQTILIDQGLADEFYLNGQLLTENFKKVCAENNQKAQINLHEGYDHSYYFISTFVENHIEFHAQYLK